MSKELSEQEIKAILQLIDDEDREVYEHISEVIINQGKDIIPLLEQSWEASITPLKQERIEELLHQINLKGICDHLLNWKNDFSDDIIYGVWIIATYLYPDIELEDIKKDLKEFIDDGKKYIDFSKSEKERVKDFNNFFFNKLNFSPNTKNFHSPSNSMINIVLESRKGNPLSLCVIYQYIAFSIGIPVFGVNLPNLFVLTYKSDKTQFYINVFNKGLIFRNKDLENYIEQLKLTSKPSFFEPCTNEEIIVRMLKNLSMAFTKLGNPEKSLEIEVLLQILDNSIHD